MLTVQQTWQKKLSGLKVAQFPWDPPPAPKQETVASSSSKPSAQTLSSNGNFSPSGVPQPQLNSFPPMKTETPSYPPQPPSQPYVAPSFPQGGPVTSAQRAAMALHDKFGDRAGESIAQMQQEDQRHQMSHPGQPGYIKSEDSKSKPDPNGMDNFTANSAYPPTSIKTEQTDGAGDARDEWDTEYARRKALIRGSRGANDHLIRDQVMASQEQLEAGGIFLPLDERPTPVRIRKGSKQNQTSSLSRAQGDAAGDEDDEDQVDDENAINSDLDDSEDENALEATDEQTDQVMLCTYDKVQRVKNKWKCTLKDGILRVDNNE